MKLDYRIFYDIDLQVSGVSLPVTRIDNNMHRGSLTIYAYAHACVPCIKWRDEPFVTWEESDLPWALYAGYATRSFRYPQVGDVMQLWLQGSGFGSYVIRDVTISDAVDAVSEMVIYGSSTNDT